MKELIEKVGIVEHQNQDGAKNHYSETNARLYKEKLNKNSNKKTMSFIAVI